MWFSLRECQSGLCSGGNITLETDEAQKAEPGKSKGKILIVKLEHAVAVGERALFQADREFNLSFDIC